MAPLLIRSWARFLSRVSCSNTQLLGGKWCDEALLSWVLFGFWENVGNEKRYESFNFYLSGFLFFFPPFIMNFEKENSEKIRSGKVLLFSAVYSVKTLSLYFIWNCFDIWA